MSIDTIYQVRARRNEITFLQPAVGIYLPLPVGCIGWRCPEEDMRVEAYTGINNRLQVVVTVCPQIYRGNVLIGNSYC